MARGWPYIPFFQTFKSNKMKRIKTVTPVTTFQVDLGGHLYYNRMAVERIGFNRAFCVMEQYRKCSKDDIFIELKEPLFLAPPKKEKFPIHNLTYKGANEFINTLQIQSKGHLLIWCSHMGQYEGIALYILQKLQVYLENPTVEQKEELREIVKTFMKNGFFLSNVVRDAKRNYRICKSYESNYSSRLVWDRWYKN